MQNTLVNAIESGITWLMRSNVLIRQVYQSIVVGFSRMACTLFTWMLSRREVCGIPSLSRLALRSIKQVAWGIKCALSRGWRKMGKILLRTCYNDIHDFNMEAKLKSMLDEAGLPLCVDDIPSYDSISPFSTPNQLRPEEINMDVMDDWLYSNRGFTAYIHAGMPAI